MVVGAKVCDLTEDLLWFVCCLYVGILTSSPTTSAALSYPSSSTFLSHAQISHKTEDEIK